MENAGEALKMAAAMLIFVGALSIAILVLSRARQTSAAIMERKDAARSYYHIDNLQSEKIVGVDTVIANLYNYYQSQSAILFYTGELDRDRKIIDETVKPAVLYYSDASDDINESKGLLNSILDKSTLRIYGETDPHAPDTPIEKRSIFGMDTHDELVRQEPWSRSEETAKQFIDALVNRSLSPGYDISLYKEYKSDSVHYEEKKASNRGYKGDIGNIFKPMNKHTDNTTGDIIFDYQLFYQPVYNFDGNNTPLIQMSDSKDKFIERVGIYNYEAIYDIEKNSDGEVVNQTFKNVEEDKSRIYFEEVDDSIENKDNEKKTVIEYIYIKNNS